MYRISNSLLDKKISSFLVMSIDTIHIFAGINSTRFKMAYALQLYSE
jgi:hypothetical protein